MLFVVANLALGASTVIYDSFLPDIAAPDERDAVSARGWGIGYPGGGPPTAVDMRRGAREAGNDLPRRL